MKESNQTPLENEQRKRIVFLEEINEILNSELEKRKRYDRIYNTIVTVVYMVSLFIIYGLCGK